MKKTLFNYNSKYLSWWWWWWWQDGGIIIIIAILAIIPTTTTTTTIKFIFIHLLRWIFFSKQSLFLKGEKKTQSIFPGKINVKISDHPFFSVKCYRNFHSCFFLWLFHLIMHEWLQSMNNNNNGLYKIYYYYYYL